MPYHIDQSKQGTMRLSRRSFIKLAGTAAACTCIGTLGTSGCASNSTSSTPPAPAGSYRVQGDRVHVSLTEVGSLLDVGGAIKFKVEGVNDPERKVIVARPGEADYRAFADACTHNGKELNYLHREGLLACCGRSSRFDLAGEVIQGPADDALLSYRLWQEGDELVIEL
jgi:Rieske Fe-S protein